MTSHVAYNPSTLRTERVTDKHPLIVGSGPTKSVSDACSTLTFPQAASCVTGTMMFVGAILLAGKLNDPQGTSESQVIAGIILTVVGFLGAVPSCFLCCRGKR